MVLWVKLSRVTGRGFGCCLGGGAMGWGGGNGRWVGFTMDMRVQGIPRNIELQ